MSVAKTLRFASVLLCCLLLFSACASPATNVVIPQEEERLLADVRTQYRSATLIVSGVCKGNHIDADGATCYDLSVTEIYAGNVSLGDTIHCTSGEMIQGDSYLLFLGQDEDVYFAEDTTGYTLLSSSPLPIVDSEVIWDGKRLSLDTLQKEIYQLSSVISASAVYYYDTLSSLTEAADEIFIGRVEYLPDMTNKTFSIRNGGAVEKLQCNASSVVIEAYGSIKGSFDYGQRITMIHCPERVSGMLDAATLQHTEITQSQAPRLQEGSVYLFFLSRGPDSKQDYWFPVNPVQGFVPLSGDMLFVCNANKPLLPFNKLSPLVQVLQSSFNQSIQNSESPALNVEK